jgi:hypothetical protein
MGQKLKSAPIPSARAKQLAVAAIQDLAEKGAVDVSDLVETGGGKIRFPTITTQQPYAGPHYPMIMIFDVVDTPALFAWAFKDALIAAINKEIDEIADDAAALSDEDRAKREQLLVADILAVEREEELQPDRQALCGHSSPKEASCHRQTTKLLLKCRATRLPMNEPRMLWLYK